MSLFSLFVAVCPVVIVHTAIKAITSVRVNLCDCHNVIVLLVCCSVSSCYCSHSHQGHHKCSCESLWRSQCQCSHCLLQCVQLLLFTQPSRPSQVFLSISVTVTMSLFSLSVAACPVVIDHTAIKVITSVPVNLCDCHNVIVLLVCCSVSSCYCSHSHQGHHKCPCESLWLSQCHCSPCLLHSVQLLLITQPSRPSQVFLWISVTVTMSLFSLSVAVCPVVIVHTAIKAITSVPVNLCDCHNAIVLLVCWSVSSCYCSHSHQGHHKCSCESLWLSQCHCCHCLLHSVQLLLFTQSSRPSQVFLWISVNVTMSLFSLFVA